jgi:hypothetical protein
MVGSPDIEAFPTAHPSFGFIGPVIGGPKDIDVKLLKVGLVTEPQFDPSQCRITPAVPTDQISLAELAKSELKLKFATGDVGTRFGGIRVQLPPE